MGLKTQHRPITLIAIVIILALLDQGSKLWAREAFFAVQHPIQLNAFLNITAVWNRGISFGLFNDPTHNIWFKHALTAIIIGITTVLAYWASVEKIKALQLWLIIVVGGAIGNIIDRLYFGAVFDFIDVHIGIYHWPAFNFADTVITIGVMMMLFTMWREQRATETT